jgi:hypothetical protein
VFVRSVRGVVIVRMSRRARHVHAHVARREWAAPHLRDDEAMSHAEAGEILAELAAREAGVEQRAEEHVPGDSRERVEMEHAGSGRPRARALHARLIRVASTAAPNPLSMLTTPTFGAQLFSIESSAVTPPNAAP